MTRNKLRTLLESINIDSSFLIIKSEKDKATIRCKNIELRDESIKILNNNGFIIRNLSKEKYSVANFTKDIEFLIPMRYQNRKQKTYFDIIDELDQINSIQEK